MHNHQKPFAIVAALAIGLLFAACANATTITYDFTVTATSGPLDGTVSNGTFAYDSSSITPGTNNNATGLLTALDFTWDGITYTAATANTGSLGFDATGQLTFFQFGTTCGAGSCGVDGGLEQWFATTVGSGFVYGTPTANGLGDVTFSPAATSVSEPSELALFGFGVLLIGAFVGLRRRAA